MDYPGAEVNLSTYVGFLICLYSEKIVTFAVGLFHQTGTLKSKLGLKTFVVGEEDNPEIQKETYHPTFS